MATTAKTTTKMMSRYRAVLAELNEARIENSSLSTQVARLKTKLASAEHENSLLRRKLKERSLDAKLLAKAIDACRYLAIAHLNGESTARDVCLSDGMPRSDWYWGRALLMDARVYRGRCFTTDNPDEIDAAVARIIRRYNSEGILGLRLRNPNREW